jgi:dTDP-4-dehydrorhamnose reductase
MKLLITGPNGTLAPRLAEAAEHAGGQVIAWDRHA